MHHAVEMADLSHLGAPALALAPAPAPIAGGLGSGLGVGLSDDPPSTRLPGRGLHGSVAEEGKDQGAYRAAGVGGVATGDITLVLGDDGMGNGSGDGDGTGSDVGLEIGEFGEVGEGEPKTKTMHDK